jgi:sec-independent protein translocase protein TatB
VFGINASEFIVLLAVAAVVVGPNRLPHYTQQLARLIRELRRMAQGAQEKVREELGDDFAEVDWRALDPRQYDPRRIVREALSDVVDMDDPLGLKGLKPVSLGGPVARAAAGTAVVGAAAASGLTAEPAAHDHTEPLFDPDAT